MSSDEMGYYHGTEIKRGNQAVVQQKLPISKNTKEHEQWLGDGIYLYEEEFYAYRWIKNMHKSNIRKQLYSDSTNLFDKFSILEVELEYEKDREFRFSNPEVAIIFWEIQKQFKKMENERGREYTDEHFINVLFNELGYIENYDIIRYEYPGLESNEYKSRIKHSTEIQFCVKNEKIIKKIKNISTKVDMKRNEEIFNKFYLFKNRNGGKNDKWKKFR